MAPAAVVNHASHTFSRQEVEASLQEALGDAGGVEILDFCKNPMPGEVLIFDVRTLRRTGSQAIWKGVVPYGINRTAPFWVRVRIQLPPIEIEAGESAQVRVISGSLRLSFTARALGSGRRGDSIFFENLSSHRRFRGEVAGEGLANVILEKGGKDGSARTSTIERRTRRDGRDAGQAEDKENGADASRTLYSSR